MIYGILLLWKPTATLARNFQIHPSALLISFQLHMQRSKHLEE